MRERTKDPRRALTPGLVGRWLEAAISLPATSPSVPTGKVRPRPGGDATLRRGARESARTHWRRPQKGPTRADRVLRSPPPMVADQARVPALHIGRRSTGR